MLKSKSRGKRAACSSNPDRQVIGSSEVARLGRQDRGVVMDGAAIRYLFAALLSAGITLGLPVVMVELGGADPSLAAATALLMAFVVNFLILKFYVYRNDGRWQAQAVRYLLVAALFRLGEFGVFLLLYRVLGLFYVVALVATLGTSFIAKFFAFYYFVFAGGAEDDRLGARALMRWRVMRN